MDDNYQTPLIERAIRMAAGNCDIPLGAIFHSDCGSNYTSRQFGDHAIACIGTLFQTAFSKRASLFRACDIVVDTRTVGSS